MGMSGDYSRMAATERQWGTKIEEQGLPVGGDLRDRLG